MARLIDADELKKEVGSTFRGAIGLTVTGAVHEIIDRQPTIDPESLHHERTVATNADRIRAMDDDELAKWLCGISTGECCDISCPGRDLCGRVSNGLAKWLRLFYKTEDWP